MATFKKEERLCRKSLINKLFSEGKSLYSYPLLFSYCIESFVTNFPAQVIIIVSKKKIKNATERNLIKRRVKEAYRLNKDELYKELKAKKLQIILLINYIGNEIINFNKIDIQMKYLIQVLNKSVNPEE